MGWSNSTFTIELQKVKAVRRHLSHSWCWASYLYFIYAAWGKVCKQLSYQHWTNLM